jgi:hypothetical protein
MSTAVWASIIVGVLALTGNLFNGYLQRKQMRQNELFRKDPSTGLMPPPHPVLAHLKKHKIRYSNYGLSAFSLFLGLYSKGPLTRLSVLNISMGVYLFFVAGTQDSDTGIAPTLKLITDWIASVAELQTLRYDSLKMQIASLERDKPKGPSSI